MKMHLDSAVVASTSRASSMQHALFDKGGTLVAVLTAGLFVAPAIMFQRNSAEALASVVPNIELKSLALCASLALILPIIQIVVHVKRFGGDEIRSNRDSYPIATGFAARIPKAHANLTESLLPFAIAVLGVHGLGISNGWTVAAALLYSVARVVHAATYLAGITVIRSAAFYAGVAGTGIMLAQIF